MFISTFRHHIKPQTKKHIGLSIRKLSVADNINDYEDNEVKQKGSFFNDGKKEVIKQSKTLTYKNLPDETLYIIDGTAMLYNAFYR
jgi:hypothetical protein